MTARDWNTVINLVLCVVGSAACFFPVYWLRSHNGDYKSGYRLILPALMQAGVGCLIFGVIYTLRFLELISDADLQPFARLVLVIYLLLPVTLARSLHMWAE